MAERVLVGLLVVPFLLGAAVAPTDESRVVFSFRDGEIVESSGLVVAGGLVVTTNDSGDTGRVFAVDPATGRTVGTTAWSSDAQDVEALAPLDDAHVWVGDIGDNTESRDSVQVAAVPFGAHGSDDTDAPVYDLVYPDGPHDAETLMTDPTTGRLYVATKGPFGGTLYAAPAQLHRERPNELEPLGEVLAIATDGAFLADGRHLVIRNYAMAAVYAFPSLERVGDFRLPSQPQGEGLALDADGTLLLGSEGVHSKVLRVSLPADAVSPAPSATSSASSPASSASSAPPSPSVRTESREDSELPETTETQRPAWPWFLGGLVGLGCIVVLGRSLRRR
jgi:outer membrane protein assembly factor BamB